MNVAAPFRNFGACLKRPRWRLAFAGALVSDFLSFGLGCAGLGLAQPLQWALDLLTAVALVFTLGFRWTLACAFVLEAFPGTSLFPCWALAVAAQAALDPGPPWRGPDHREGA